MLSSLPDSFMLLNFSSIEEMNSSDLHSPEILSDDPINVELSYLLFNETSSFEVCYKTGNTVIPLLLINTTNGKVGKWSSFTIPIPNSGSSRTVQVFIAWIFFLFSAFTTALRKGRNV